LTEILQRLVGRTLTNQQLVALVAAVYSLVTPARTAQLGVADTLVTASAAASGVSDPALPSAPPAYPLAASTALIKRTFVDPLRARGGGPVIPIDLDRIVSGADRHIRQAGRDRVLQAVGADSRVPGWARMGTGLENCAFCDLLISRGAVYRSLETASFTSHDNCDCIAVPVFDRDDWAGKAHSDALYAQYKRVTKGYSGQDAINAWRRHRESLQTPAAPAAE
jgi:hypothetical protein